MYLFDNLNIKLVRESDVATTMDEDDDLNEVNSIPPLLSITPRLGNLFTKLDDNMCKRVKNYKFQPPPAEIEVDQVADNDAEVAGAEGAEQECLANVEGVQGLTCWTEHQLVHFFGFYR